jgi:hypothetical protein
MKFPDRSETFRDSFFQKGKMMIKKGMIVVHRNTASPFPMYFYALEEHNHPDIEELPGGPGFWYGLYVLPDFLAEQVSENWQHFHPVFAENGRRFVVDVGLPMYVQFNQENVVETFAVSMPERQAIRKHVLTFLFGDEDEYDPSPEETAFLYHPEYTAAFKLTKRAQGLSY